MRSLISEDENQLLGFCLDVLCHGEARVAVFGPEPEEHTALILERPNLSYVDCGRHYDWSPRLDALSMVLADGAKVVLFACPNYPTGTVFPVQSMEALIVQHPGVTLVVDRRWSIDPLALSAGNQTILFGRTGKSGGSQVFMSGTPLDGIPRELPEGISWTEKPEVSITVPDSSHLFPTAESLRSQGFRVEEGVPSTLFVQKVGWSADQLADELKSSGFLVEFKHAHTWRNGVCLRQEETS